jgi:hypothetical protein
MIRRVQCDHLRDIVGIKRFLHSTRASASNCLRPRGQGKVGAWSRDGVVYPPGMRRSRDPGSSHVLHAVWWHWQRPHAAHRMLPNGSPFLLSQPASQFPSRVLWNCSLLEIAISWLIPRQAQQVQDLAFGVCPRYPLLLNSLGYRPATGLPNNRLPACPVLWPRPK